MLKIAWTKEYNHPLPDQHRFPMIKYDLLPEQLLYEGTISEENLFAPQAIAQSEILNTHESKYWEKLNTLNLNKSEIRKTGFPLSKPLVTREIIIMQGTLSAALFALKYGVGMNIAGGTHHAFTNRGEGFCLLNDIAIAANHLLINKHVKKILVIDLDVHQGNGTAEIFKNNPAVFTFSMHGANNYPLHKEQSDKDIALPDQTNDEVYIKTLDFNLKDIMNIFEPDFVFYQAGVDILSTDKLGRLSVSRFGCRQRDELVLTTCKRNNIPVAINMGGGYSEHLTDIIEAHANTYRLVQFIFF